MGWRLRLGMIVAGAGVVLSLPVAALASQNEVLLCYGATYAVGGIQRTHRGADVAPGEDDTAHSFTSGEVSFAGRIPADEGGSVFAVTVRTSDGLLVTVHPLSEVWVGEGETVCTGDGLGQVAASGDSSVADTHVHVSARRGDTYLDPSFLITTVVTPLKPNGSVEDVAVASPAPEVVSAVGAGTPAVHVQASASAPAQDVPVAPHVDLPEPTPAADAKRPAISEEAFMSSDEAVDPSAAGGLPARKRGAGIDVQAVVRGLLVASAALVLMVAGVVGKRRVLALSTAER